MNNDNLQCYEVTLRSVSKEKFINKDNEDFYLIKPHNDSDIVDISTFFFCDELSIKFLTHILALITNKEGNIIQSNESHTEYQFSENQMHSFITLDDDETIYFTIKKDDRKASQIEDSLKKVI